MFNPSAAEFTPTWLKRPHVLRRTNQEMRCIKDVVLLHIQHEGSTSHPPYRDIPVTLVPYLSLPRYFEYIDMENATKLVEGSRRIGTIVEEDPAAKYFCTQCANSSLGCDIIRCIISAARKRIQQCMKGGSFLCQGADVVFSLVQLKLVFESKRTSLKLRHVAIHYPSVVRLVEDFLCGEGFHIPAPALVKHEEWRNLLEITRFDYIRDNRTRILSETSKYWKKSNSAFEQFAYFLNMRDAVPLQHTKGLLTHAQKPVLVAALVGDIEATVILCDLGFFVPPDYFWGTFNFLKEKFEEDPIRFGVLRHLLVYYFQQSCLSGVEKFNPIPPPKELKKI